AGGVHGRYELSSYGIRHRRVNDGDVFGGGYNGLSRRRGDGHNGIRAITYELAGNLRRDGRIALRGLVLPLQAFFFGVAGFGQGLLDAVTYRIQLRMLDDGSNRNGLRPQRRLRRQAGSKKAGSKGTDEEFRPHEKLLGNDGTRQSAANSRKCM